MASKESSTVEQEAVVLFDYDKEEDDDLTIKVGQVIKNVIQVADSGWCTGELDGVKGMFPLNYVEIRPAATNQEKEYYFANDLSEDYTCQICMKLLSEPQLTDCCGQHFCRTCLDRWFQRQRKKHCPHCRSEDFTHILSKPLKRKIHELKVYCSYREKGCGLTLKLEELERHLSTDNPNGCGYVEIECPNKCKQPVLRKDMEDHSKNKCPERNVTCEYCNEVGPYFYIASKSWNSGHIPRCLEYPVDCPNKCTVKGLKRKDVAKHKEVCPLEPVECPFYATGCKPLKMVRKDLDDHMKSSTQQHLLCLMTSHTKLMLAHEKLLNDHKELKLSEESFRSNVATELEDIKTTTKDHILVKSLDQITKTLKCGFVMHKIGDQLTFRIPYNYQYKSNWVSPRFAVGYHSGKYSMMHTLYIEENHLRTLSLMLLTDTSVLNERFEIEADCMCDKHTDKPFREDPAKPLAEALHKTNTVFKVCAKCNELKRLENESMHKAGQEIGTHHLPYGFAQAYYEFCIVTLTLKEHSCN